MRIGPACAMAALLTVTASAPAAAAAPCSGRAPLRFSGTRPAVEVTVNGQGPFLFLVDTGAGGPPARADAALVAMLGIAPTGSAETSDGGSARVTIDRVRLDNVTLAGCTLRGVEALSRDYGTGEFTPKLYGILGPAFFSGGLLTIDYRTGWLSFGPGELPAANGRTVLDYELVEGNIAVDARLGGRPVKAVVDTGNIRAIDVPAEWLQAMRFASFPRTVGNSSGVSGTTAVREVTIDQPLIVGGYRLARPQVTFSTTFAEANLGSAFWRDYTITIDQQNKRVRLIR